MKAWQLASVAALAVFGCTKKELPTVSDVTSSAEFVRGYVCTAAPSEAFSPGFVYRVDENGDQLLVKLLMDQAETFKFRAALGTYTANLTRAGGLSFSLDSQIDSVSGGVNAAATSTNSSKVAFSDGQYVLMTDDGVAKLATAATKDITPVPGSRYFVVRDVIQAKGIDISITKTDEANLGGHAQVQNIVSANPSLSFKDEQALAISGTFDAPLNVCIRAVSLQPVASSEPTVVAEGGAAWEVTTLAAPAADVARLLGR